MSELIVRDTTLCKCYAESAECDRCHRDWTDEQRDTFPLFMCSIVEDTFEGSFHNAALHAREYHMLSGSMDDMDCYNVHGNLRRARAASAYAALTELGLYGSVQETHSAEHPPMGIYADKNGVLYAEALYHDGTPCQCEPERLLDEVRERILATSPRLRAAYDRLTAR